MRSATPLEVLEALGRSGNRHAIDGLRQDILDGRPRSTIAFAPGGIEVEHRTDVSLPLGASTSHRGHLTETLSLTSVLRIYLVLIRATRRYVRRITFVQNRTPVAARKVRRRLKSLSRCPGLTVEDVDHPNYFSP